MKLVLVEWIDSRCRGGWHSLEDVQRDAEEPMTCESVGWLVSETDSYILLAPNRSTDRKPGNAEVCDLMQIPIEAIRGKRLLTVGRKTR